MSNEPVKQNKCVLLVSPNKQHKGGLSIHMPKSRRSIARKMIERGIRFRRTPATAVGAAIAVATLILLID